MPVRAENLRKSEVVHITMAQPAQYIGEHFAEKSYRRFSGRPHLARLQRRMGRCKPKTINHLMSLANEWADGEDSIAVPRSPRRSADRYVDPKDQFHSSSRKKGHRNRYEDGDTADMVVAGYVNNDHDNNHEGPRQGSNYYGSSSRSAGRDSRPKTKWRRRRDAPPHSAEEMLNRGCTRHTYIDKDGR
jgi:hypothetical protein